MNLYDEIHRLLEKIGVGWMMDTTYDTAWVARLATLGEPIGESALDWLRSRQLADGSWGALTPLYYHDRVICTLAAIIALARQNHDQGPSQWQRVRASLEHSVENLTLDPAGATVGFEMIVPTLVAEAETLGIFQGHEDSTLRRLSKYRAAKLAALPGRVINRHVTVAHSAEMVGADGLSLLDVEELQEANGSVAYSPSATAYFALHVRPQDPAALSYLHKVNIDGGVPNVAPFDIFEPAWTLWNLAITGSLDDKALDLCQPHLDFLEASWRRGQGVGFARGYTPADGDDTAVVYEVLGHFGRQMDLETLQKYEEKEHFRCFALEANPSVSANIHMLGALRQAGLETQHPSVQKILSFLQRVRAIQLFWFDKWHASPYYPTSHAIIASAGYADHILSDAIFWMIETQNKDGSWGYYMPTAEETAYCLQALVAWKQHTGQVPNDILKRGFAWLADHAEPPYPPLWIGKCLYCPVLVVRSAILGALLAVQEC